MWRADKVTRLWGLFDNVVRKRGRAEKRKEATGRQEERERIIESSKAGEEEERVLS